MTNYHLTPRSANIKLGPIAAITASKETCPASCPFKGNGCYAENFPLKLHWDKVSRGERGGKLPYLLEGLRKLPEFFPVRYAVAGDLPPLPEWHEIIGAVRQRSLKMWTYTHNPRPWGHIGAAKVGHVTVNISCEDLSVAKEHAQEGSHAVCVVPSDHEDRTVDMGDGIKGVQCPATYQKSVNCGNCMLCYDRDPSVVILFPAHGTKKKTANRVVAK